MPSLGDGMVLLLSRHTEPGPGLLSSASPEASRDPSPLRDRSESVTLSPSVIRMELASGVFDARHADNTEVLLALLTQNKELEGELKPVIGYRCMPVRLQSRRTTKISSTMYLLMQHSHPAGHGIPPMAGNYSRAGLFFPPCACPCVSAPS